MQKVPFLPDGSEEIELILFTLIFSSVWEITIQTTIQKTKCVEKLKYRFILQHLRVTTCRQTL